MKKILVVFGIIYTAVLGTSYASSDQNTTADEKQCFQNTHGPLDFGPFSSGETYRSSFCFINKKINDFDNLKEINANVRCFESDSDACITNTTVCILGSVMQPDQIPSKFFTRKDWGTLNYHTCAVAKNTGAFKWDVWTNEQKIPDCPDKMWAKNASINKTTEVLVIKNSQNTQGTPSVSKNNYPMQYYIEHNMSSNSICIGYYCKDANGKYQAPKADGSCATKTPATNPDDHIDEHIVGFPRNTVAPYLNALQDCKN